MGIRKSSLLLASMALGVLLVCGVALAAAGDLDRTFGGDGKVTTRVGDDAGVTDLIVQPDGKLVAAGTRHTRTRDPNRDEYTFALARYLP